ncbi:MAG: retroviral-like aspartic protease family protein [Novosphingobium sp.]|nr:aspartyl protease family protein [Novosphingobium sp.]MCB2077120.1 aspartyl protease family protein [Novosphingobium sp.]
MHGLAHILPLMLANTVLPTAPAVDPGIQVAEPEMHATGTEIVGGEEDRYDRMTLPVHIGEHGPFRFLLDTGSQSTVLSTALADQLALPPGQSRTIISIAGPKEVRTAEVERILLGKRSYFGLEAPLLERNHIGADGILGIDSLQGQRVLVDFRDNFIAVNDTEKLAADRDFDIVVRARRRGGQLIMTHADIDGKRTRVIIDTGSDITIGNRALQRALSRRGAIIETVLQSATGQRLPAQMGFAERLSFGEVSITNVAIAFADAAPFKALELDKRPALMLGMRELRVFRRIAIDFSKRKVLFDLPPEFEFEKPRGFAF